MNNCSIECFLVSWCPRFQDESRVTELPGCGAGLLSGSSVSCGSSSPLPSLAVRVAVTVTVSPTLSLLPSLSLCLYLSLLSPSPSSLSLPPSVPPLFLLPLSSDSELGWLPRQVLCWLMDEPLLVSSRRHEVSRLPHLCGRARGLLRAPSGGPEQTWAWEGFGSKRHSGCDPGAELGRRLFQTHLSFIIVCWSLSVFKGLLELIRLARLIFKASQGSRNGCILPFSL